MKVYLTGGRASIQGLAFATLISILSTVSPVAAQTLATYRLTTGWATFGLVLPQGAARDGVRVGSLATQTDVKTTWSDGSIRFAVVTARVLSTGNYAITAGTASAGTFTSVVPQASVVLTMNGTVQTASLPTAKNNVWLNGPLVVETRHVVTPGTHPFLRVLYDTRMYNDGTSRVDVTVANTLNIATANAATYDVGVFVDGAQVFSQAAVNHGYMARWRRVFGVRLTESAVTPDFTPFVQAKAIPDYSPLIDKSNEAPVGSVYGNPSADPWGILEVGSLHVPMEDHGGRPEIAPYPDWTARYLAHKMPTERASPKLGELGGSYNTHLTEADGTTMISIDRYPNSGSSPDSLANRGAGLTVRADIAPAIARVVPYLVTGDRFFLDEASSGQTSRSPQRSRTPPTIRAAVLPVWQFQIRYRLPGLCAHRRRGRLFPRRGSRSGIFQVQGSEQPRVAR